MVCLCDCAVVAIWLLVGSGFWLGGLWVWGCTCLCAGSWFVRFAVCGLARWLGWVCCIWYV